MTTTVLVVTPTEGFGDLIRQTLENAGGYRVSVVENGRDALVVTQIGEFDLAIIDFDLVDVPIPELENQLKESNPDLHIILVPPGNDLTDASLADLSPDGFLTKPFYLPDLLVVVETVLKGGGSSPAAPKVADTGHTSVSIDIAEEVFPEPPPEEKGRRPSKSPPPPWLQDVNLAARHLAQLSLETAAKAALITRDRVLWAYAGELPNPAAEELAVTVVHYWSRFKGNDLARFLRLEATGEEYMLYATALVGDMVLALVFDAVTPFSRIRTQAAALAEALASHPEEGISFPEPAPPPPAIERPARVPPPPPHRGGFLGDEPIPPPDGEPPAFATETDFKTETPEAPETFETPAIPSDWQPVQTPAEEHRSFLENILTGPIPAAPFPYETPELDAGPPPQELEVKAAPPPVPVPSAQPPSAPGEAKELGRAPDSVQAETRPSPVLQSDGAPPAHAIPSEETQFSQSALHDPTLAQTEDLYSSPAVYYLSYACVLIPRFPHHHLVGKLAGLLGKWIPQVSVAFGWRVDRLSIRPDYLQWVVNVPPATSPSYLMRIIRRITSQRIFAGFPSFEEDNPSGDFWAPGYLIISSSRSTSQHLVQDFIGRTRKRQGFTNSR